MAGIEQLLNPVGRETTDLIGQVIESAREHLEADISFLARFEGDRKIIMRVARGQQAVALDEGTELALDGTYCARMVGGRLPNIVSDARHDERVRNLVITEDLKIGAYIGVPVLLEGGRVYGTLCCINHQKDEHLRHREVKFMRVLADVVAGQLQREESASRERQQKLDRIRSIIEQGGPTMVFQPIVDMATGAIIGAESLSRFYVEPKRSPDLWFAEAWEVGQGEVLELAAVKSALAQLDQIDSGCYVSVNVSPQTLLTPAFEDVLSGVASGRVVVEVTEHAIVDDYQPLVEARRRLRNRNIRLAVDDVGAGYSGLTHILRIAPNLVKLDLALTRDIHKDPAKQALAAAAASFASRMRVDVVAEGVETLEEAEALRVLGIHYGQGYYFSKPAPLPLRVLAK